VISLAGIEERVAAVLPPGLPREAALGWRLAGFLAAIAGPAMAEVASSDPAAGGLCHRAARRRRTGVDRIFGEGIGGAAASEPLSGPKQGGSGSAAHA
jgi:hypothetical protein